MMGFLEFLENMSLSVWLREAPTVLGYPTVLAFHTFGMAFLVGTSAVIALRILGFAPGVPLAPLRKLFPIIKLSIFISTVSGVLLLILDARNFLTMPAFYLKLLAIVVAVVMMRSLQSRVFGDRAGLDTGTVSREAQILAGAMLISWTAAITAGRVTAYDPFVGRQTAVAVLILAAVLIAGGYGAAQLLGAKHSAQLPGARGNVDSPPRR